MLFSQSYLEILKPETARLISRADHMTDKGAEKIVRTNAWIKATDYAYANQDWLGYIGAIFFAMWSMECNGSKYKNRLLQYSNDYINFYQKELKDALAHAGIFTDWANRVAVDNFSYIYDFYCEYYQISDEKIEQLLKLYNNAFQNNVCNISEYYYMFAKMRRGMCCLDKEQTSLALRRVMALEREIQVCYVCKNQEIIGALLLLGRIDEVLQRIKKIISDAGIPEWWYKDYGTCENANAYEQYSSLLCHAFWLHMPDEMRWIAQEYQSEILTESNVDWKGNFIVLAITRGADVRRAEYLDEFAKSLDNISELTPLNQLMFLLTSWAYLEMLYQSGVNLVLLTLVKPVIAEKEGGYNTHELAQYCLKKADKLGAKFDQSRPTFGYQDLRNTTFSMLYDNPNSTSFVKL